MFMEVGVEGQVVEVRGGTSRHFRQLTSFAQFSTNLLPLSIFTAFPLSIFRSGLRIFTSRQILVNSKNGGNNGFTVLSPSTLFIFNIAIAAFCFGEIFE